MTNNRIQPAEETPAPFVPAEVLTETVLPKFEGYEQFTEIGQEFPVTFPTQVIETTSEFLQFQSYHRFDESECRDAFVSFASSRCCYDKTPAKEHQIQNIEHSRALHYVLETFCEGRTTGYTSEPFTGQPIDGPGKESPPGPWDVQVLPDEEFKNHVKKVEVPGTASVQRCSTCYGVGMNACATCSGIGNKPCTQCSSMGTIEIPHGNQLRRITCTACAGRGTQSCSDCSGTGRVTCGTCKGHRQMKCYLQLVVTFKNHMDDFILETTSLPDNLIRKAKGDIISSQIAKQVGPMKDCPVEELERASERLVESHKTQFPNEKRINQRQTLRGVSVAEVDYCWKDISSRYWVYGERRRIYCPEYPRKCCCCVLM